MTHHEKRRNRQQPAKAGSTVANLSRLLGAVWGVACACAAGCTGPGLISSQPAITAPVELCGDRKDNDGNGRTDCEDLACSRDPGCRTTSSIDPLRPQWPVCATAAGDRGGKPVDIVWAIDSSASMDEEMQRVQHNINRFVAFLTQTRLDSRVVLLGGQDICVPEPLGGPGCGDGPRYRHIDEYVGSHNSLSRIVSLHPFYRDFLRPDGRRVFIVTTDDESQDSAAWFELRLQDLNDPALQRGFVFNSIVSFGNHPRGCLTGRSQGRVYLELTAATGGVRYPICETNWSGMLDHLANDIVELIDLPCTFDLQVPPDREFDPKRVQVNTMVSGQWLPLPRREGERDCQVPGGGWYLSPTADGLPRVRLCESSCNRRAPQEPPVRQVEVFAGCKTIVE